MKYSDLTVNSSYKELEEARVTWVNENSLFCFMLANAVSALGEHFVIDRFNSARSVIADGFQFLANIKKGDHNPRINDYDIHTALYVLPASEEPYFYRRIPDLLVWMTWVNGELQTDLNQVCVPLDSWLQTAQVIKQRFDVTLETQEILEAEQKRYQLIRLLHVGEALE